MTPSTSMTRVFGRHCAFKTPFGQLPGRNQKIRAHTPCPPPLALISIIRLRQVFAQGTKKKLPKLVKKYSTSCRWCKLTDEYSEEGWLVMKMTTIQGPAIFLAQFAGDHAPFNNLKSIAQWASSLGYKGVQIPS